MTDAEMPGWKHSDTARRVVLLVAAMNLAYFGVEFAVALKIGSVSLFADSIDFLEDAWVNFLIAAAIGWRATLRARVGMLLTGVLLVPAIAALWAAWTKLLSAVPPAPVPFNTDGSRRPGGQSVLCVDACGSSDACRESYPCRLPFSAKRCGGKRGDHRCRLRNSATRSVWPDLVVGLGIVAMNAGAAREVWLAAREEHRTAVSDGAHR